METREWRATSWGHSRHDAGEVEHFGRDVGQVAVQEDEEGFDDPDVVCEPGGEGRYEAQQRSNQHPADPHHEEVGDARKHVDGLDGFHLAEGLEQVVQDLGGEKAQSGSLGGWRHTSSYSAVAQA